MGNEGLLDLLDLSRRGTDRFVAVTPGEAAPRLFGGQVASQSLRAATLTVDAGRRPHSLHAYFVRPGRPGIPLDLEVERTRDGRSFTTRQVTASQAGETIFVLAASFHIEEEGDDWQTPSMPDVPGPEDLPRAASPLSRFSTMSPFELRWVREGTAGGFHMHPLWARVRDRLPDDPALHACAIAFMSDMGVVAAARGPATGSFERFMGASLDHALWFHRPARADDWLLFDVQPVTNSAARGLAQGTMHTREGVLVASIAQEALLRPTGTIPLP